MRAPPRRLRIKYYRFVGGYVGRPGTVGKAYRTRANEITAIPPYTVAPSYWSRRGKKKPGKPVAEQLVGFLARHHDDDVTILAAAADTVP